MEVSFGDRVARFLGTLSGMIVAYFVGYYVLVGLGTTETFAVFRDMDYKDVLIGALIVSVVMDAWRDTKYDRV